MATKRNPEERSAKAATPEAAGSAKPTGDEVFDGAATSSAGAETSQPRPTAEEAQGRLQQLATEYYENLSETASELSRQASEIFAVGTGAVQQNVWESIGLAAGVGLVIGLLID